jgi:hypothetical protein
MLLLCFALPERAGNWPKIGPAAAEPTAGSLEEDFSLCCCLEDEGAATITSTEPVDAEVGGAALVVLSEPVEDLACFLLLLMKAARPLRPEPFLVAFFAVVELLLFVDAFEGAWLAGAAFSSLALVTSFWRMGGSSSYSRAAS